MTPEETRRMELAEKVCEYLDSRVAGEDPKPGDPHIKLSFAWSGWRPLREWRKLREERLRRESEARHGAEEHAGRNG